MSQALMQFFPTLPMKETEMGECKTEKSCDTSHTHEDEGCTIAEDLLCLAKSAKHELIQEKMKKILEAKIGKKLDKVAEVAVEAALACMQNKMAEKQACNDYQEKLMAAFKSS